MPSNHLILLSYPSLPAFNLSSIRVFSKELVFCIRWTKYWNFSFSISLPSAYSGLISLRIDWFDLLEVQGTQEFSPTPKSINSLALSFLYDPTLTSIHDYWKNHTFDQTLLLVISLFNMLSSLVIAFFQSKHLSTSWLQSPSAVTLEPKKMKSVTVTLASLSTLPHRYTNSP